MPHQLGVSARVTSTHKKPDTGTVAIIFHCSKELNINDMWHFCSATEKGQFLLKMLCLETKNPDIPDFDR